MHTPQNERADFIVGRSRPATPEILTDDEGMAGDTEDEKSMGGKKGKQRAAKRQSAGMPVHHSTTSGSGNTNSRPNSPSPLHALNVVAGEGGGGGGGHTYPPSRTPPLSNTASPSRPGTPTGSNDEIGIVHAAKALKTAVLHDARNILHHDEDEAIAGLGWSVNSPREAKVSLRVNVQFV